MRVPPENKGIKQKNALLYATEEYHNIGRTKLMKFIFFVDLIEYNDNGDTLLEDCYKRVPYGPAPSMGMVLTDFENELFKIEETQYEPDKKIKNYRPKMQSKRDLFNSQEIELFNHVLRFLKRYRAETISDLTHELTLWQDYENGDTIPKERLKLDNNDYFEILSLLAYHDAKESAKVIECEFTNDSLTNEDSIPQEFLDLQLLTLKEPN